MTGKDYLTFLNIAGVVCSILALMLTLSQNVTMAIVVESLVAVVFFIATAGTLGAFAHKFEKWIIVTSYWPYHLLFWMAFGMAIAFASFIIASIGYMFTAGFIHMFTEAIRDINQGHVSIR